MNTANKLTILRVVMIPAFLLVLYLDVPGASWWALAIFVAASVTDTLDGYIARHYDQITDFGKFMDPLADKCLVTAAMLWFVEVGRMPAWALLIVIVREFGVSGLRMVAADKGRVIAAGWSGKVKTASTMVCIVTVERCVPGGRPHLHRRHRADHHLLRGGIFHEEPGYPGPGQVRRGWDEADDPGAGALAGERGVRVLVITLASFLYALNLKSFCGGGGTCSPGASPGSAA